MQYIGWQHLSKCNFSATDKLLYHICLKDKKNIWFNHFTRPTSLNPAELIWCILEAQKPHTNHPFEDDWLLYIYVYMHLSAQICKWCAQIKATIDEIEFVLKLNQIFDTEHRYQTKVWHFCQFEPHLSVNLRSQISRWHPPIHAKCKLCQRFSIPFILPRINLWS